MIALRFAAALIVLALPSGKATPEPQHHTRARSGYGYLLGCDATLYKVDLSGGTAPQSFALSRQTKLIPTTGDAGGSTYDGCVARGAEYVSSSGAFLTIVPDSGSYQSGGRHFRLLVFSLSTLHLKQSVALPNRVTEEDEAYLRPVRQDDGSILIQTGAQSAWQLSGTTFVPANPANLPSLSGASPDPDSELTGTLDLSHYRLVGLSPDQQHSRLHYSLLQASGTAVLLHLEGVQPDGATATEAAWVVIQDQQRLILLRPAFPAVDRSFQLAPGGSAVAVQESMGVQSTGLPELGHRLVLLDSRTGEITRRWGLPANQRQTLQAVSGSGTLLLFGNGQKSALQSGMRFTEGPVRTFGAQQLGDPLPHFFADR